MSELDAPSNPYHDVDEQVGVPKKLIDVRLILRIVWSMLRRRWLAIGIATVLALGVGAVASKPLTQKVWKSTGLLLYTAPTVPNEVNSLEASFALTNISGFATCRPVLTKIKENLGLQFPVALMARSIKVETSRNSSTVFMSLSWGDKKEANQIMEQLTLVYPEHVARVRQSIAGAMLKETEMQVAAAKARHGAARTRFRDFTRDNNIIDFKQDLILMQTKVLDLESRHAQAKRNEHSLAEQVKMLDGHIRSIQAEQKAESAANSDFEAAEESLADNRRRQNRLRELITEERRMLDMQSQIEVKRREYERAKVLSEKQLISNSEFERVRGELESMIAKITESESIKSWKTELDELDKLVVPTNKTSKKASPIIQQILFKKLETQLNIALSQHTQVEIDNELRLTRTQITTFQRLRNELATLEDDIAAIGIEREQLESRAGILRQLATMGATEFSVVSPVSTGDFPISSNRKKMFMAIVLATLMLTGTTIAGFDVLLCGIIPTDVQVELMGLPIISRFSNVEMSEEDDASELPEYSEDVRLLALQLRQRLMDAGSVALFSNISTADTYPVLIKQLSKCLSGRDERVLILDAQDAADGLGPFVDIIESQCVVDQVCETQDVDQDGFLGVRDWLSFRCDEIDDIIFPTVIPAVDCILPGRPASVEDFVTMRMSQLMTDLRERYTIILVVGPQATDLTELQVLASYSQAIAFVFNLDEAVDFASGGSIRQLATIKAPMIGAIAL